MTNCDYLCLMNCVNRLVEIFLAERVLRNLSSNGFHRLIKLSRSKNRRDMGWIHELFKIQENTHSFNSKTNANAAFF